VDCRNFRSELGRLAKQGGEPGPVMRAHLAECGECQQVAAAAVMARIAGHGSCPDGFDLASLVGGGETAKNGLSAAVHAAACSECSDTVTLMRRLKEEALAPLAHGADATSKQTSVVDWLEAAGEARTGVLKWLRTVVRDQFWIPSLEPVGAIQGPSEAQEETDWRERYRGQYLEVLDPYGASLPDIAGMLVVPLAVDRSGIMSSTVDISSSTVLLKGDVSLFLDLHGRGVLRIGPSQVDRRSPHHLVAVFEASGFDRVPMIIPLEEYCIVFDLT
jgi:hypothetical protein